jgi:hypothetical protein
MTAANPSWNVIELRSRTNARETEKGDEGEEGEETRCQANCQEGKEACCQETC